jgi:hypothetical protein
VLSDSKASLIGGKRVARLTLRHLHGRRPCCKTLKGRAASRRVWHFKIHLQGIHQIPLRHLIVRKPEAFTIAKKSRTKLAVQFLALAEKQSATVPLIGRAVVLTTSD